MFQQKGMVVKMVEVSMSINNDYKNLLIERRDDFLLLTLNRPDKLNALNAEVLNELKSFLAELHSQSGFEIKGLVFTGAGDKAFIAGADIAQMSDMEPKDFEEFAKLGQTVTVLMENLKIPVIAAVNGFALGGGCEMAMGADFIYATKGALFGQPEVKLGLLPGFGGTQRLSKLVGRNRAKELIFSGRNFDVNQAKEYGLVLEIFESKEELLNASFETLKKISRNSPLAVSASKQVMNEGNDLTIEKGLECEVRFFVEISSSEDKKEGTAAFVEKRKPVFKGK